MSASVDSVGPLQTKGIVDCSFRPFLMKGFISLTGNPEEIQELPSLLLFLMYCLSVITRTVELIY